MSLYTPIFPHTSTPLGRTASSSSITTATSMPIPVQSYSANLLQWHLAIASLPEVLCPPSAPASPTSRARSLELQAEIEQAVREKRYVGDLCKLRCTVRGYATTQPAISDEEDEAENGNSAPWILPETEEEWFEWERQRTERRASASKKGKARETRPPVHTKSQDSREKVLDWKTRLCTTKPSTNVKASMVVSGRTPLGFPVVKRSSVTHKEVKNKTSSLTPIEHAVHTEAPGSNSQKHDVGQGASPDHNKATTIATDNATDGIIAVVESKASVLHLDGPHSAPETTEVSFNDKLGPDNEVAPSDIELPLHFPNDLATSTQKPINITLESSAPDEKNIKPSISNPEFIENSLNSINLLPRDADRSEGERQSAAPINPLSAIQLSEQPTPPSPPPSSASPPGKENRRANPELPGQEMRIDTNANVVDVTEAEERRPEEIIPKTPPAQMRPLTPVSNDGNKHQLHTPKDSPPKIFHAAVPRTPERTPLRKRRTVPYSVSPAAQDRVQRTASHNVSPQHFINGGTSANVHSFPVTPPRRNARNTASDGAPSDVLATSRRSLTRPRPPSRKALSRAGTAGADLSGNESGIGDPSPAKSERSYFSSPASSGSSSAGSFTSAHQAPGSPPLSPLGGFTQNPGRFAPLAESTQQLGAKVQSDDVFGLQTLGAPTQASSMLNSSQFGGGHGSIGGGLNESQKLGRFGSGVGFGLYNSQFDVDANIDRVSSFMEQDVDFSAWLKNMDDDEDEEGAPTTTKGPILGNAGLPGPIKSGEMSGSKNGKGRESVEKDEDEEAVVESLAYIPLSPIRS